MKATTTDTRHDRPATVSRTTSDAKGTVVRVVDLIRCFAEAPQWTLSDIAERVGLPRSTAHRLLQLLRSQGFVDEENRQYSPGSELHRVAALLAARMPLVHLAMPILRRIVDECDETAILGVYQRDRRNMVFAAKVDSAQPVRYMLDLNVPKTLLWGATGRAILAFLDDDEIDRILAANTEPSADGNIQIDRDQLHAELATIRHDGYALSRGQRIAKAVGIAAPFFYADGSAAGDIALTIPEFRFNARKRTHFVTLIREGAQEMSDALGHGHQASGPRSGRKAGVSQ